MKFGSAAAIVLMFLILTGCDNGEGNPQRKTLLTFDLNPNFMDNAKDKWIFATNENGDLLSIKRLTDLTTSATLGTDKPFSSINLTIVSVYDVPSSYTFYSLETFKGFPSDESITLGTPTATPATVAGNAAITITNYTESLDPRSNLKFSTKPYGSSGVFNPNLSGTTYSVSTLLYQGFTKVHIYGQRSGEPVYKMISNINPGDAVSIDFNAFQSFDHFRQFNSFYGFAYVIGIEADESQFELIVSDKESSLDARMLYIGYVPGFPKYLTYISSFSGFEYVKVGSAATTFTPPSYATSITNNTLSAFKGSINTDHDYKVAQWRENVGSHRSTWIVHADKNTHPNVDFDLPQELTTAYPNMTKEGLELSNGSFIRSNGTFTYLDMLAGRLKHFHKPEYEIYTMGFD